MAEDTITRTMTVDYVQPSPRKWENTKGGPDLFFVSVNFSDGSEGSIGVVEAKVEEAKDSLKALVGSATEFELKAGKEYNGQQQWKLYDWPGKPTGLGGGAGGGGGRGGGGMSHSQAGLLAAATLLAPRFATGDVNAAVAETIRVGEILTDHLFTRQPKKADETTTPTSSNETAPSAAASATLAQVKTLKEAILAAGLTVEQACQSLGVEHLTQLTPEQAKEATELYQSS